MNQQQIGGYIKLKMPSGLWTTHISLASGKTVSPDPTGHIYVAQGDAAALLAHGWQIVQPLPPSCAA